MALAIHQDWVTDSLGNIIANASVEVRRESDNALAAIYGDRDGIAAVAGSTVFTDSAGYFSFYVAGGAYKLTIRYGSVQRIKRYVAVGTAQEGDATAAGRALINSTVTAVDGNVSGVNQLTAASRITANADASAQALDMIARADDVAQLRFLNHAVSDVQATLFSTSAYLLISAPGSRSITFSTNGVDRAHITGGGKVTIGSGTVATSAAAVDGGIQVRSNASPFPSTGKGVEITYPSGSDIGYILSYDRDGSAFKPLWVDSSALTLNQSGGGPIYCKGQFGLAEYTVGTASSPAANNLYITVTDLDTTISGTAISGHGGGANKRICISASGAWHVY